jgi:hypothetical protein
MALQCLEAEYEGKAAFRDDSDFQHDPPIADGPISKHETESLF